MFKKTYLCNFCGDECDGKFDSGGVEYERTDAKDCVLVISVGAYKSNPRKISDDVHACYQCVAASLQEIIDDLHEKYEANNDIEIDIKY